MTKEEVDKRTILRSVVGSTAYGLAVEGSDEDVMGVLVEPIETVIGLDPAFEQYEQKEPDIKIYSLRKFLRLAMTGNPNILELFFIKPQRYNARGSQMLDLREHIISRHAAGPYMGYMRSQLLRLKGEKGQKRCHRPEYENKYGYDSKYAMHMLRLGFQGIELLTTGALTFPIKEPDRSYLRGVREGLAPLEEIYAKSDELEELIKKARDNSPLPRNPNRKIVEDWMITAYERVWVTERQQKDWVEDRTTFNVRIDEYSTGPEAARYRSSKQE